MLENTLSGGSGPPGPTTPSRLMRAAAARPYAGRSDVYRWLRQRHGPISEAIRLHRPSWAVLIELMLADGVSGRSGAKPNAKSVPKVWARVCRDLATEARFEATGVTQGKRRVPPSFARPLGSSEMVERAAPQGEPSSVRPATGDTMPGVAGPVSRSVSEARRDAVMQSLKSRSGG